MDPFSSNPIVLRDPRELSIHPALKAMPRLAKDDPRYDAMRNAWRTAGMIDPLYVTAAGEICDGRHRWWFAKDMQLKTVPTM